MNNSLGRIGAVVLAAGGSSRLGVPKQLLLWRGKPFIWHVVNLAMESNLEPVVVVTGSYHQKVCEIVEKLHVVTVHNRQWENGQGSSISEGVKAFPDDVCATFFLLVDQPQIKKELIRALVKKYLKIKPDILAPKVGLKRGNPVLFDRKTFDALMNLTEDHGGRSIFKQFKVEYLSWHDEGILMDIDTQEDYLKLLALE